MDRIKGITEARRAALALATKRAAEAEQAAKVKESLLKERTKQATDLQNRVELTRQSNRLMKDLLQALQKLDEAKKKLDAATEKSKIFEIKQQELHDQADSFESKFQESKKKYNQLVLELDNLSIN
ncbi:hypothetical protein BDN70DRAFT_877490 [Pholiota conissans]|uniref:Tropomyosin n=1 Tax=Pholiota conissans TaxID=109636 RepID=A0A9P6D1T4_9AGAR|nr:hypothetical protein BDN70DRAFT_877490 [Pholiota conissans]